MDRQRETQRERLTDRYIYRLDRQRLRETKRERETDRIEERED